MSLAFIRRSPSRPSVGQAAPPDARSANAGARHKGGSLDRVSASSSACPVSPVLVEPPAPPAPPGGEPRPPRRPSPRVGPEPRLGRASTDSCSGSVGLPAIDPRRQAKQEERRPPPLVSRRAGGSGGRYASVGKSFSHDGEACGLTSVQGKRLNRGSLEGTSTATSSSGPRKFRDAVVGKDGNGSIPNEILARGERAQRKFREALAKGKQQPRTLKVMFVGSGRAGKTSTLKSLCNEAFDASEASTHGLARGVCSATVKNIGIRGSGEWRRLPSMHDSDFVDSVFDAAVARHVAAELRRPSTRGAAAEAKRRSQSCGWADDGRPLSAGSKSGSMEDPLPPLDRPSGWAPVIRWSGGAGEGRERSSDDPLVLKMPVDLVIQHMQDGVEDSITLQTFDFAGQEEYYTLHHLFMSNKGLYIMVFNLAQWLSDDVKQGGRSAKETANEMLIFWISSVLCHAPESKVLLVGTHLDMLGNRKEAVFKEVEERIQQLLERNHSLNEQLVVNPADDLCFFPIDNRRKGRPGVDALRSKLDETATQICTQGFLSKELPIYWLKFQTELLRLARMGPERFWAHDQAEGCQQESPLYILRFPEVARLARAVGIADDVELQSLLIFLHDTGCIIFFDEAELREHVILDPHWLAEAAANIFNCPRVVPGDVPAAKRLWERGELHVDFLRRFLWKAEHFAGHVPALLQLLVRFDLLVASPTDPAVYIVPSLLPLKTGSCAPVSSGSLTFDFHGMLTRLLPTVFPRIVAHAAKSEDLKLTYSRVYRDSATIFLGRKRLSLDLVPPTQPEMIAIQPLGNADGEGEEGDPGSPRTLPLDLARHVISLVQTSCSEWLPHVSFTAGVLCPLCVQSGNPHVIDVAELGEEVIVCSRTHEPVSLKHATWAAQWRQEASGLSPLVSPEASRHRREQARSNSFCTEADDMSPHSPEANGRQSPEADGRSRTQSLNSWMEKRDGETSPVDAASPLQAASRQRKRTSGQSFASFASEAVEPAVASTSTGSRARASNGSKPPQLPTLRHSSEVSTYSAATDDSQCSSHGASPLPSPGHGHSHSPSAEARPHPAASVGRLYFMYASPLNQDQLDVRSELQLLQSALAAGRQGLAESKGFEVSIDVRLGRADNLLDLLTHGDAVHPGSPIFLHLAMHAGATADGPGSDRMRSFILLEDHVGAQHILTREELLRWLRKGCSNQAPRISAVFVNSCDSQGIASAFMEVGVPHVICCSGKIFDGACRTFTRALYRSLGMGRSVYASFEHAREAVACSPQVGLRAEASKFILMPRQEDLLCSSVSLASLSRHHLMDLRHLTAVPCADEASALTSNAALAMQLMGAAAGSVGVWQRCRPPRTQHFLGRLPEMIQMAEHLAKGGAGLVRVVNVWGASEGVGKTALLAEFTRFFVCPGRLFEAAAIWAPLQPAAAATAQPGLERTPSHGLEGRGDMFLSQVGRAVSAFMEAFGASGEEASASKQEGRASPEGGGARLGSKQRHGSKERLGSKGRLASKARHGSKVRDGLLASLRQLERERSHGGRVLLVLDGIEDWIDSAEVKAAIADMLHCTERLCLVFGSRIHVQNSFAGLKTDNLELKPLKPRDAAQLFLYRVHRQLYWKDLWRTKDDWMANAKMWYGGSAFSKVSDRAMLDKGEVPIALDRSHRNEVLDALGAMPLLSEFCQGVPLRIQQTAERVTAELGSLWDLLDSLRAERDRDRLEIHRRLLSTPSTPQVQGEVQPRQRSKFWQLGKVIGQGAYGIVHHAFDSASGESFAVKIVEETPGMQKELELYKELDHPHIVKYFGHEQQDQQVYIFLEYMAEGSLKEKLLQYGAFQEDLCCKVAGEILRGLEYLHRKGILHRDLKCSNLLLDSNGRVKISDFGCSRWVGSQDNARTFVGSPWWLPPEMLGGEPYNHAADIWSYGCTMIELLTGKSPWSEQITADHPLAAVHQILKQMRKGVLPGPGPDFERFSAACREFVWTGCLALAPAQRQTATQLLAHPWLCAAR